MDQLRGEVSLHADPTNSISVYGRLMLFNARRAAARKYHGILQADLDNKLPHLMALAGSERNMQRMNSIAMYQASMTKEDMHLVARTADKGDGEASLQLCKVSRRRARTKVCAAPAAAAAAKLTVHPDALIGGV